MTLSRSLTLGVVLCAALVAVWALGRSTSVQSEQRVRAEMRDSVAWEVSRRTAPLRRRMTADSLAFVNAERARQRAERQRDSALVRAERTTADSRDLLANPPDSVHVAAEMYRSALQSQVLVTDSLAVAFRSYVRSSDSALTAGRRVIASQRALIAHGDTALIAMTQARDAWRGAATCMLIDTRWLKVRCPTRTEAAVGSVLVGAAAGIYLGGR